MANLTPKFPRRVVQIGDKYYALLRQFSEGQMSVVWQAQPVPDSKRNDSSYSYEAYTTQQRLWAALKEKTNIRHDPDNTIEANLVAIKTPKSTGNFQDLRDEAKNLRNLRGASTRSQRIIELIDDLSSEPDCPCLILAWAQGTQLDKFSQLLSERDGLLVGFQVAQVIEAVFNLRYTPLTDSIKPNSIFWDEDSRRVTIIDLGLIGDMVDLETQTLPIFGDTMHRIFTSQHVGNFSDKGVPIPDQLWAGPAKEGWQKLSFSTRQTIQNLFNGSYLPQSTKELKGNDLYNCLSQTIGAVRNAFEEQIALWDEPGTLLQKARQAELLKAINIFDIARGKGEIPTEEDKKQYFVQWSALIWGWLENANHEFTRFDIHWFHEYAPDVRFGKRAWLANQAAREDANLEWSTVLAVLKQMQAGDIAHAEKDYVKAVESYKAAWTQIKQVKSRLLREIEAEASGLLLLAYEQLFFTAVTNAQTKNITRDERALLLKEALSSWHEIKSLRLGDKEGDYNRWVDTEQKLFQIMAEQAYGDYQLNKYGNIAAWIETLRENAPEKTDLIITQLEKWGQNSSTYEQQMAQYQRDSDDLKRVMQVRAETLSNAHREMSKQQSISAHLIELLQKAIKANFTFDPQGHSLHLALGMFLADLGRYAEATASIEASRPVLERILESTNSGAGQTKAWLSENEKFQIRRYLDDIEELATQQKNILIEQASPDVLNFYMKQQRSKQSSQSYLARLGLSQLLQNSTDQEIGELHKLHKENIEKIELALSYLSLALIADPENETTRGYFDHLLDVWRDNERKKLDEVTEKKHRELNEDIVGKLKAILRKERLDQAINKLDEWVQMLKDTPEDQHSSVTWLTLANHIQQTQSLLDTIDNASDAVQQNQNNDTETDPSTDTPEKEGKEGANDLDAPPDSPKVDADNSYQQSFELACQNVGIALKDVIERLAQSTTEPKFDDDSHGLVDSLQQWQTLLPQLKDKLKNSLTDLKPGDWDELEKCVATSLNDAERTVAIASLKNYLQIGNAQAAYQEYSKYTGSTQDMSTSQG